MGNAMTIQPIFFNLLFTILVLYVGLDFTISGILLRENFKDIVKPKLLGLLILKYNEKLFERLRQQNELYQRIYSFQSIRLYTAIAGILLSIGSAIQITDILLRL